MDLPILTDTLPRSAGAAERMRETTAPIFAKHDGAPEALGIIGRKKAAVRRAELRPRFPIRRAAILLGVGSLGFLLHSSASRTDNAAADAPIASSTTVVPPINLPPPNLYRPLSPDEAAQENAARPFVKRPDTPASKFVLRTDSADRERALACLTQAVYYEAAGEGVDGGRAVAQIVLNRMHHPGYPASVCGVVYQGADRTTGCQFTFTCDGSLLRTPVAALWTRSQKIAEEALAGRVFAPVGHATHYHADYVLPYWADSLDKTVQIGRHIFYRLPKALGDSRSFFQRYAGAEPQLPQPDASVVIPASAVTEQLASALISDDLNGGAAEVEKAAQPVSPLAVDSSRGTLIADGEAAPMPSHRSKSSSECTAARDRTQLAPLGAIDMHAAVAPAGC
jgi:spore germination cell wall hydrolase CwlJ-like protein